MPWENVHWCPIVIASMMSPTVEQVAANDVFHVRNRCCHPSAEAMSPSSLAIAAVALCMPTTVKADSS